VLYVIYAGGYYRWSTMDAEVLPFMFQHLASWVACFALLAVLALCYKRYGIDWKKERDCFGTRSHAEVTREKQYTDKGHAVVQPTSDQ